MDGRFRQLSLTDRSLLFGDSDLMDVDAKEIEDIVMEESIPPSPSLPLRYHDYFHQIRRVSRRKSDTSLKGLVRESQRMVGSASVESQTHDELELYQQGDQGEAQQEPQDTEHTEEPQTPRSKTLIQRVLFSPTNLGAELALKTSQINDTQEVSELSQSSDELPIPTSIKPSEGNSQESLRFSDSSALIQRSNTPQLVKLEIHHHHHYYPETQELAPATTEENPYLPSKSNFNNTPYFISTNLQAVANFMATIYGFYIVFQLVSGMKADIDLKLREKIHDLTIEVALCRENFELNKCFKDTVVPVVRGQCIEWEKCMSKDPFSTSGKLVITLQSLGMIVNAFLEPITIHSCLILLIAIPALFLVNVSFGFLRLKIYINNTPLRARQP